MHVGVGQQTQLGEHRGHLQVHLVGLGGEGREGSKVTDTAAIRETGNPFLSKVITNKYICLKKEKPYITLSLQSLFLFELSFLIHGLMFVWSTKR